MMSGETQQVVVGFLKWIPLVPAMGALWNAALGHFLQRRAGKWAVHTVAIGSMCVSLVLAFVGLFTLLGLEPGSRLLSDPGWRWISVGALDARFAFAMDPLGATMALVVTVVGTLIHVYSIGYMADDPSYWRFFCYMNLFCFAMLTLVLGDNFLLMFVGWEGVGLASYLLIGFWYKDLEKAQAGMKAFLTNRFGDAGFVIGLFLILWAGTGHWAQGGEYVAEGGRLPVTFRALADVMPHVLDKTFWGIPVVTLVGILFFWGATAKSAQIPLYVWLPDAMAGPTPVSALIHAATMVTAGVYMVARLNFMYVHSPLAMTVIAVTGAVTALFAATMGFFQYDIKKVLAYSTVSQLGFMFIGVGVGTYWAGVYHLMTHAFFKACLFLCAGSVILGMHHEQDMRRMGGLKRFMPATHLTYLIACITIAGFPVASGFYSKDEILWKAFDSSLLVPGVAIWALGAVAALGTSFYMFRSYYMTFSGENRRHAHLVEPHAPAGGHDGHPHGHDAHGHGEPHESPATMTWVLWTLAALAILASVVGLPMVWTHHAPIFEHFLHPSLHGAEHVKWAGHGHGLELGLQAFSVLLAAAGWYAARTLYKDGASQVPARLLANATLRPIHKLVYNKYWIDELYGATVIRPSLLWSRVLSWFDSRIVDGLVNLMGVVSRAISMLHGFADQKMVDQAVNGVAGGFLGSGQGLRRIQTGRIQDYVYILVVGAIVIVLAMKYLAPVW